MVCVRLAGLRAGLLGPTAELDERIGAPPAWLVGDVVAGEPPAVVASRVVMPSSMYRGAAPFVLPIAAAIYLAVRLRGHANAMPVTG
jgi:hypothetical protein